MDPGPARYAIRVSGHLGPTLLSAFPALASRRQGAHTVLTGLMGQSALFGVLAEIEALGLELIEVRQLARECELPESGGESPGSGDDLSPGLRRAWTHRESSRSPPGCPGCRGRHRVRAARKVHRNLRPSAASFQAFR
jgi:hypothetical protein